MKPEAQTKPMSWQRTMLALLGLMGLVVGVGSATWTLYRRGRFSQEASVQSPPPTKPVFPEGESPRVRLLDLRIAAGSLENPDEVILVATAQYEGPIAETIDLTGFAFSLRWLCGDAIISSVAPPDEPENELVYRGRFSTTADPFSPFSFAFACGRRGITTKAAENALAAERLLENITDLSKVPLGVRPALKFVDLVVDKQLRVRPWEGPRPSLNGEIGLIPPGVAAP